MSDLTDRAYAGLRPDERIRAALSAAARHDGSELDRLFTTCQQKTYRMEDQDFVHPLKGFALIAERQKARLTQMVLTAVTLALVEECIGDDGVERIGQSVDRIRAGIKGVMEAWETFCRELELTEDETTAFAGIAQDEPLTFALDLLELQGIETDDAVGLGHLGKLRAAWARYQ